MGEVKQITIKNRTYYFYNYIINITTFDARLLKIDKKYKNIGIYNIGYITKKKIDDCQNIYIMNSLYLIVANASGYIEEKDLNTLYLNIDHASGYIKEKGVNKYFVFLTLQIKIKSYWKNIVMFGMEFKTKSEK